MRPHSMPLFHSLARGLTELGVDVVDIGVVSTPMTYYANGTLGADGSVMITASHNPGEWNGFKLCREKAIPISGATGILYNITASASLTMAEIEKISDLITKNADADATIKFGVIEDSNAGDMLRVTVIATGFKEGRHEGQGRAKAPTPAFVPIEPAYRQPTPQAQLFLGQGRPGSSGVDLRNYVNDSNMPNMTHGPENFEDPLDVPTFQRLNPIKKK
jgi:hypothetical protein